MLSALTPRLLRTLAFAIVLSLLAPLLACTWSPNESAFRASTSDSATYRVGMLMPLTGQYAVYGVDAAAGIEFAVEEINAGGGIAALNGMKIELVKADTTSDPRVAVAEYERLVKNENVDFVVGPSFASAEIKDVAPFADRYEMPTMSIGGPGDDVFTMNLRWVVHLGPFNYGLGAAQMAFALDLAEEFNLPRDNIVYTAGESPSYKTLGQGARDVATARGYGEKLKEVYYSDGAADLTPVMLGLKAMKPDILVANSPGATAAKVIKAMRTAEFYPRLWSDTTVVFDPKTKEAVGSDVWNRVVLRAGVIGYAFAHHDYAIKPVTEFEKRITPWLAEKGLAYTSRVAYAEAIYALVTALDDARTRDKVAVNKALHRLSIGQGDPRFVAGQFAPAIEFEANGRPKNFLVLGVQQQLHTGSQREVLVYPRSIRTAGAVPWVQ